MIPASHFSALLKRGLLYVDWITVNPTSFAAEIREVHLNSIHTRLAGYVSTRVSGMPYFDHLPVLDEMAFRTLGETNLEGTTI